MADFFAVGSSTALFVTATPERQVRITNSSGGTLYYKTTSDVSSSSNDGNLTAGQSLNTSTGQFVISASGTNVIVEQFTAVTAPDVSVTDDLSVTDDATIGDALAVTGATTTTGGLAGSSVSAGYNNIPVVSVTGGTDTAFANGTQFVTSIVVPFNKTVTNINYLVGSVGGTDKVYGVLYSSAGAVLANSSLTGGGATAGTAAQIQTLALTATYAAKGPATFFVGISANGNTAKIRTVPAHMQSGILAGSVSQTHGTVAAITAPTTFTADKAPYVFLD